MASIIYKPVCSSCGKVIPGKVSCINGTIFTEWIHGSPTTNPSLCPHCNEHFETIIVPCPNAGMNGEVFIEDMGEYDDGFKI